MALTFAVPLAVQETARRAIEMRRKQPLQGCGGHAVAERLVTGTVDADTLAKVRRFFAVNQREHTEAVQQHLSATVSPVRRTWLCHGGDAGRVWSTGAYAQARKRGFVEEDPQLSLFRAKPDDVYGRFSMGAWRWEYGLTPRKAARFVEEYQRATGENLDIDRAFGDGAGSVQTAIRRRKLNEDPFQTIARVVTRRPYQEAARLDLHEIKQSIGQPAMCWPTFLAHHVLAAHAPKILAEATEGFPAPPDRYDEPRAIMEYTEPIASYVSYFHPHGARFPSTPVPKALLRDVDRVLWEAHEDELRVVNAQNVLGNARRWTAVNRLAGGLGHVLLEAWRREEYDLFLAALPLDADVRAPFERFMEARRVVDQSAVTP